MRYLVIILSFYHSSLSGVGFFHAHDVVMFSSFLVCVSQENIVVTSSKIKHAYLSTTKDFRCIFGEILHTKLTKDFEAFVAAYINAHRSSRLKRNVEDSSKKKKRRVYRYRDAGGAGGSSFGADQDDDGAEEQEGVDGMSASLQARALGEIVSVLGLPSSFLNSMGSEIFFAECTVRDFASHITDHLLTSGTDMHAHGVDIHNNLGYFEEFDEKIRQNIKYVRGQTKWRLCLLLCGLEFCIFALF